MKILFHSNQISLRGTEIALYDYARENEQVLGNESLIVHRAASPGNSAAALEKFSARFKLFAYENFAEVDALVRREGVDRLYMIKSGENDGFGARECPTLVHAVFPQKRKQVHGDRYAFVSQWLSQTCSGGEIPYVPHMVGALEPDQDLRKTLNIASDAFVFGGYGGEDSFDIPFARDAIAAALDRRSDLRFLFMNFRPFLDHERVTFLPGTADPRAKANFIAACDAMLHARKLGESFGLACGEFSIMNKPVLSYGLSKQRAHLDILGDKALVYRDEKELTRQLLALDRAEIAQKNWDAYSADFCAEAVMARFQRVFLDPAPPPPAPGVWARLTRAFGRS